MRVSGMERIGPLEVWRITLPGIRISRPGISGVVATIGPGVGTGMAVALRVSSSGIQIVKGSTLVFVASMGTPFSKVP